MSDFLTWAEDELRRVGLFDKDSDYGGMAGEAIMRLCRQFSDEGHSGFSAAMTADLFARLARWEPLSPLTGDDDEWTEVSAGCWQNKRCPRVFKEADGRAYDIDGKVFREPDGVCFTSKDSRVYVEFPYVPKTVTVDVPAHDEAAG